MLHVINPFVGAFVAQLMDAHTVIRYNDLQISYHGTMNITCDDEEYRFQAIMKTKLSDCVIECALREHCAVMNYRRDYALCELHQINVRTSNLTENCFRVERDDIHITQSPCQDMPCPNGTACDRKTKTCQTKECLEVPRITNGRVLGNLRGVGNRIKYECDQGYQLMNISNEVATCLENGTWSMRGECMTECLEVPYITNGRVLSLRGVGNQIKYECDQGYQLKNSSHEVATCLDNGTWSIRGECMIAAPAVGQLCNAFNCLHPSARCVEKNVGMVYCHCQFGFEFNGSLGICVQECKEYSTNSSTFEGQNGAAISGYNSAQFITVASFHDCVNHCNTLYPQYLSIDLRYGDECSCGTISEHQHNVAHGPVGSYADHIFYNRPCAIKA